MCDRSFPNVTAPDDNARKTGLCGGDRIAAPRTMPNTVEAYDLGAVDAPQVARPKRAPYAVRTPPRAWGRTSGPRAELSATLSLFVPGSGQLLRKEGALGLFFLTSIGFLLTFGWALLKTFDRLAHTLALLEIPLAVPFLLLGCAYVATATLHVTAVLSAAASPAPGAPLLPHPLLSGLASTLAPGWGQLLNGDRGRAGLFLGGLWVVGAVWLAGSETATEFFNSFAPAVSAWEQTLREPIFVWAVRFTLPALLWSLAVYDAVSSAASRR